MARLYRKMKTESYTRSMRVRVLAGLLVGALLLGYGTVAVFIAFDQNSHSVSDTVRPFVLTMAPVWAVAIAAAVVLLRQPER